MIFDKLSEDVLKNEYFQELYEKLSIIQINEIFSEKNHLKLTEKDIIHLLRFCDILSNSTIPEARNVSYKIISLLNQKCCDDSAYRTYSTAVLSKLGNFPAMNFLNYGVELPFFRELEQNVKEIKQKVPGTDDMIFTDPQYSLFKQLKNSNFFSFSGPTSMGKSFMIKRHIYELLNTRGEGHFAIIVPTRALINQFSVELRKDLKKILKQKKYEVITNSNISEMGLIKDKKYIFVLTPERLMSYLSKDENPELAYLFIDEAHKLTDAMDYRSITLYNAIERTIRKYNGIKLYFAAPNIANPEIFLKLFNKNPEKTFKTIESPVTQNLFLIDLVDKKVTFKSKFFDYEFKPTILDKFSNALDVIRQLGHGQSNIIYCSSRHMTIDMARRLTETLSKEDITQSPDELEELKKAIKLTKEFIHKDYYLVDFLQYGVGFHFGTLPQLIRNCIERLYKKGIIKYLFCTSTLLEGVNLPAKNMFILNNKKGRSNMTKLDFWNLGGRAGRLNCELYGNVYCVRDNSKVWKKTDIIEIKSEVKLKISVSIKIEKQLKKIEKILLNPNVEITPKREKEILKYIANIICIDTLELKSGYTSPVLNKLIQDNKDEIIEYAKEIMKGISVPKDVVLSNQSIMVRQQNQVYEHLQANKESKEAICLPKDINFENCLEILEKFHSLYNWENSEKSLKRKESLKYFAFLMNIWINGYSLSYIIQNTLKYNHDNQRTVVFYIEGKRTQAQFDINNIIHVNSKINELINNIEGVLRFTFEKYFNNYFSLLSNILGEENAGVNWANYLEYGTRNSIIISLQNLGFSRHVANNLYTNYKIYLQSKEGKLVGINKKLLLNNISKDSVIYEEVSSLL